MGLIDYLTGRSEIRRLKQQLDAMSAALPMLTKASEVYADVGRTGSAGTHSVSRYYRQLGEEGFAVNPIVRACIQRKRDALALMPWRVIDDRTGDVVDDHPMTRLLAAPNVAQTASEWWGQVVLSLDCGGGAPIHASGANASRQPIRPGQAAQRPGLITELYTYRPDQIEIVSGQTGVPSAYAYVGTGSRIVFPVDPITGNSIVRIVKTINEEGGDPFRYGTPPLKAAAREVDIFGEVGRWNFNTLDNQAAIGGYFRWLGSNELTPEQIRQYSQLIQEQLAGAKNGRRTPFMGNMEFNATSSPPGEMEFQESQRDAARYIALVLGVPPQLIGIPGDNTYSNYSEAKLAFYTETAIPLADTFADFFNRWLMPAWGEGQRLTIDEDRIDAIETLRVRRSEKLRNADWMTDNEKRAAVGLPPHESEEADALQVRRDTVPMQSVRDVDEIDKGLALRGYSKHMARRMLSKCTEPAPMPEVEQKTDEPQTVETAMRYYYDESTSQVLSRTENGWEAVW